MTMNASSFETRVKGSSPSSTNFSGGGYNQVPSAPFVMTTAVTLVGRTGGNTSANVALIEGGEGQIRPTTAVTTKTRRDALRTFRPASDSNLIMTRSPSSVYCYNNGSTTSNILLPPNHGDDTLKEHRRMSDSSQGMHSFTNNVSRRASASHVVNVSDPTTTSTTRTTRRHSSSMDTTIQPHLLNISGRKLAPPPKPQMMMMSTTPVRSVTTHDVGRGQEAEGSDWKRSLEYNPSYYAYQHPPPPEAAKAKSSTTGTTTAKGAFRSLNSRTTDITMVKPVRRSSDPTTMSSAYTSSRGQCIAPPVDGRIHTTTAGVTPTNKTSKSKPLVDEGRSRIVSSADKLRFYRWTQNGLPKEDTVSSLEAITKSNTNKDELHPKEMKLFKNHRATLSAFYPNMNTTTTSRSSSSNNTKKKKKHDPQVAKQSVVTTTASTSFFYSFQSKSAKTGKK